MPHKKAVRVTRLTSTGSHCTPVDLRSVSRDEPATAAKPVTATSCPACGKGNCDQYASRRGHACYRCLHCYNIFSVSTARTRIQSDEYERWLADMAS